MKVTEFFIGFGPRIWSFRRGETEYGVKVIPAGAYVKIIGMSNLEEVAPEDEARTYRAKSFGKRMPVVLAGPAMNLLHRLPPPRRRRRRLRQGLRHGVRRSSSVTVGLGGRGGRPAAAATASSASTGRRSPTSTRSASLVQAHAGTDVELTVVRDGQRDRRPGRRSAGASPPASAGRLGSAGRRPRHRGRTASPSTPIADLVEALQNADGPVTLTYDRAPARRLAHEVAGPIDAPGRRLQGLPRRRSRHGLRAACLACRRRRNGASAFGDIVVGSVQGIGQLLLAVGLGNLVHQVATATDNPTTAPRSSIDSRPQPASSSTLLVLAVDSRGRRPPVVDHRHRRRSAPSSARTAGWAGGPAPARRGQHLPRAVQPGAAAPARRRARGGRQLRGDPHPDQPPARTGST